VSHTLTPSVHATAITRVRGPIVLNDQSRAQPDLTLLRYRSDFYADSDETPEDILLVVEVAETSERYDRRTRAPLYARFGLRERWIVDLTRSWVMRYLDPTPEGYGTTQVFRRGESLSPLAFPDLLLAVNDILG
jgi:Uma2 family endonuclease